MQPNFKNKKHKSKKFRLDIYEPHTNLYLKQLNEKYEQEQNKTYIKTEPEFITSVYEEEYQYLIPKRDGMTLYQYDNEHKFDNLDIQYILGKESCDHWWFYDYDLGASICEKCLAQDILIIPEIDNYVKKQSGKEKIWKQGHDRGRWTRYVLGYLNGEYNYQLDEQCWCMIIKRVPENFTWYQVYKVFQKLNLKNYFTSFGSYIGLKIVINPKIVSYAEHYTNESMGKNRIPYLYLLFKFTQMFGEEGDEKYIPIKQSGKWFERVDMWWREICKRDKLTFKSSKIYKIYWNRDYHTKGFTKYLLNTGQNSNL